MFADWAVAISAAEDDPVVVVPWAANAGDVNFVELCGAPENLLNIPEAKEHAALAEALRQWNAAGSPWRTLKCDTFAMDAARLETLLLEMDVAAAVGYSSYVDVALLNAAQFARFETHENLMRAMCADLANFDFVNAAVEFILRRCIFADEERDGFCISIYVHGLGADERAAYACWSGALTALVPPLLRSAKRVL